MLIQACFPTCVGNGVLRLFYNIFCLNVHYGTTASVLNTSVVIHYRRDGANNRLWIQY